MVLCSIFQGDSISGVKSRIRALFEKTEGFAAYVFWRSPWKNRFRKRTDGTEQRQGQQHASVATTTAKAAATATATVVATPATSATSPATPAAATTAAIKNKGKQKQTS